MRWCGLRRPVNRPEAGHEFRRLFFIREHSRVFERMGVLRITGFSVAVGDSDAAARALQGGWASPGLTDVFGVQPVIGRWFREDDTEMGS